MAPYVYICAKCGKEQKLRFKPKEEYCQGCFRDIKLARMPEDDRRKILARIEAEKSQVL